METQHNILPQPSKKDLCGDNMEERKVTVKDKKGNLIAVFSNLSTVHEAESQKSLMHAPTIDIVSNGESTLIFQMLITSDKWQQIKNPENLYYCNHRVYTALNEQSIIYDGYTVSVSLVEIWYLLKYKFLQAHNVDIKLEPLDTHTVKILPKTDKKFKLTVNGVAYDDSQVRDSRGVLMPRGSAGYALWAILKGTDWKLGVCDVLPDGFNAKEDYGTFNVESDMKSALENIQIIQSLYGGILDWDSENKVLNLRDERKEGTDFNTWKGFVARSHKNLIDFPVVQWDNNLVTRLYPLGNGNLNIAKVNNGENYLDNFSYTKNIYEGYLQNGAIYDTNSESGQKTLKYWGERKLAELCKPRKSITYNIVDKRGTSEGWAEPFDINDIVKAYYIDTETGKEVWEYLRITHLTYNWFWPGSDTKIEVGDKVSNEVELFHQVYKFTENAIPPNPTGTIDPSDIVFVAPEEYWKDIFEYPDVEWIEEWLDKNPDYTWDDVYPPDKYEYMPWEDEWYEYVIDNGGGGYVSLYDITSIHAEHETKNTQAVADLHAYADDTFSTIESFTTFQKETKDTFSESFTQINQVSDALGAQVTLEANHYKETTNSISQANASINVVANDLKSEVKIRADFQKETKEGFVNTNASITAVANDLKAEVNIRANFQKETEEGFTQTSASIKAVADNAHAEASINAQYINQNRDSIDSVSKSLAEFKAYAGENYATVSALARVETDTSNSIAGFMAQADAKYASASIVATVNSNTAQISALVSGNTSFANISANYITISGQLTTSDLVASYANLSGTVVVKGNVVNWITKTVGGQTINYLGR